MNNDVSNDETYNHFNYKSSIISSTFKAIMKMFTKTQQIMCSRRQCLYATQSILKVHSESGLYVCSEQQTFPGKLFLIIVAIVIFNRRKIIPALKRFFGTRLFKPKEDNALFFFWTYKVAQPQSGLLTQSFQNSILFRCVYN
uniref:Uncharacterized protein n=1 Tax=Glossina austeni TaxID=7395 RepID=A0A1A9VTB3_GLOAU